MIARIRRWWRLRGTQTYVYRSLSEGDPDRLYGIARGIRDPWDYPSVARFRRSWLADHGVWERRR